MDYQEVVELLKSANRSNDMVGILPKSDISKFIIHAMQELLEYHKTGLSPKQVADTIFELSATKRVLGHYQQLGTLEEVLDAVEKQKKKKPIEDSHHGIRHTEVYRCPSCNGIFSGRGFAKYCFHCGQAIDWGKEEFQAPYHPNKCHVCFGAANNDCERCMDGNEK